MIWGSMAAMLICCVAIVLMGTFLAICGVRTKCNAAITIGIYQIDLINIANFKHPINEFGHFLLFVTREDQSAIGNTSDFSRIWELCFKVMGPAHAQCV